MTPHSTPKETTKVHFVNFHAVKVPGCSLPYTVQAKEALKHPYFDDLDKEVVDALENPELEGLDDD